MVSICPCDRSPLLDLNRELSLDLDDWVGVCCLSETNLDVQPGLEKHLALLLLLRLVISEVNLRFLHKLAHLGDVPSLVGLEPSKTSPDLHVLSSLEKGLVKLTSFADLTIFYLKVNISFPDSLGHIKRN